MNRLQLARRVEYSQPSVKEQKQSISVGSFLLALFIFILAFGPMVVEGFLTTF